MGLGVRVGWGGAILLHKATNLGGFVGFLLLLLFCGGWRGEGQIEPENLQGTVHE